MISCFNRCPGTRPQNLIIPFTIAVFLRPPLLYHTTIPRWPLLGGYGLFNTTIRIGQYTTSSSPRFLTFPHWPRALDRSYATGRTFSAMAEIEESGSGAAPHTNGVVPIVNGRTSYAARHNLPDHFIGGNKLENAAAGPVKDFVANNDGHTVITNVSISRCGKRGLV